MRRKAESVGLMDDLGERGLCMTLFLTTHLQQCRKGADETGGQILRVELNKMEPTWPVWC